MVTGGASTANPIGTVVEVQTTSCVIKSNDPDTMFKLGDKASVLGRISGSGTRSACRPS